METVGVSAAEIRIRRAGPEDAAEVARLLHDFNSEYAEPTPGVAALTGIARRLLGTGEMIVLLTGPMRSR
jgi:hypothetical protein